jgi:hypothetical protein
MLAAAMHAVGPRTVAAAIALTMLASVVAIGSREPPRSTTGHSTGKPQAPERAVEAAPPRSGALPPEVFVFYPEEESAMPAWLAWLLAGVVLTGILSAGLLFVRGYRLPGLRRRMRRSARRLAAASAAAEPSSAAEDDAEAARRAVHAALEPLRDPADPRAAVIAAYARMEQALTERELGRRTPEAPREYLSRVLREQGMPERSLTTLTALFEEARFSLHSIPHSAPRRALSELENARVVLATLDEQN